MAPQRRTEQWAWLWLLPALFLVMVFEHGVIGGFWRFVDFLYVGSFVMLVALLVSALLGRVLLKGRVAVLGVFVTLYSLFWMTNGNGDKVFNAAAFGVLVGSVMGGAIVFVSSSAAEKVRSTERSFYTKLGRWLRGKQ